VRHIHLSMPGLLLRKLIATIDGEFPMLRSLFVWLPQLDPDKTNLILPKTLQAPHLRELVLTDIDLLPVLQILTTCTSLVTLALDGIYPTYSSPNDLLQHLSLLPRLKFLIIDLHDDASNTLIEQQLLDAPAMTHVTLPDLCQFQFGGTNAYLEALLSHMTTPILETLVVLFFPQVTFSTPNLLQFMNTTKSIRLTTAEFGFGDTAVTMDVHPEEEAEIYAFCLEVTCQHLDEQVSSMVQIFDGFGPAFSAVERLTLAYHRSLPSPSHGEIDPAQWRRLLRPFKNVKTLLVDDGFVELLNDDLQPGAEGHPLESLPELKELSIPIPMPDPVSYHTRDPFNKFINARQVAGRPVILVRH